MKLESAKIHSSKKSPRIIKIVIVGDSNVGKTTILQSLSSSGELERGYSVSLEIPTTEKEDATKKVGYIFDLRSQRYFPYLHSLFYNKAHAAIIVFDVNKRSSFESIEKWRDIIWGHVGNIPLLICGNKSDLSHEQDYISLKEALDKCKKLADKHDQSIEYIELSALKRIIAHSTIAEQNSPESKYPTADAFREPFINWLIEVS